jgi:hypothetical protein
VNSVTNISPATRTVLKTEWHPTRNQGFNFDNLSAKTNLKVWWLCSKNAKHEWQARFRNRVIDGDGCPFCSGRKVLREDSFGAQFPKMLAEWHPTKNGSLDPFSFRPLSNKRVWWQCQTPYKHEWQTTVCTRVRNKSGCKQCNNIPKPLGKTCPEIARQWHPTRNGERTADDVSSGSKEKVWWLCETDPTHEWKAGVYGRVRAKSRCPICARKNPAKRLPALHISFPKLAAQWHPTKNGTLKASDVFPNSTKEAWWICPVDPNHVWRASIRNRAILGNGCRFCAPRSKYISPGRSFADKFPQLAAEWHPTKNGTLKPSEVKPGSSVRVWWQCKINPTHEWQATITVRTQKRSRGLCPHCSGQIVSSANSLQAKHPDVAKEWHPIKNAPLTPDTIKRASGRRVWWRCSINPSHEWLARVKNRTILRNGCPYCAVFHSAESNANYFETFENDFSTLRALSKQEPPKIARLRQAFLRMLYSSAITALETYLSDAFFQTVIKDEALIEKLLLTTPEFKDRKYSLSELVEWKKQTNDKVSEYLFNIVWHNLAKVRCMYRDVLGINFPDDSDAVHAAVVIRHDIVHRGGKTKTGKPHNFRETDIEKLFTSIEAFVTAINIQLKTHNTQNHH